MRQLFVAGNWKMNLDAATAVQLATEMRDGLAEVDNVRLAVMPPYVYIQAVADALKGSNIDVGGQNMYTEESGAYTGEVAGPMLKDVGCRYVILGHSERRHVFGEPDDLINAKVHKALGCGLEPVLCVGEKLEQREAGETGAVVGGQVRNGLQGVSKEQMARIVLAYEPVWAIGTGKTATPEQAQEVHEMVRGLVAELYDQATADATIIQYGGSVKPTNAAELMSMPDVDGGLVGGASLKADLFVPLVEAAAGVSK